MEQAEKKSVVVLDEIAQSVSRVFDYPFDGETKFDPPELPKIPEKFGIGLIVGPSGSGKSTLLEQIGCSEQPSWDSSLCVASHFSSESEAIEKLSAVGLNSIPSWLRPYHVLSTGEKFRADLARQLENGAVVDEFTSVIDRNVAKAASYALRRYVDKAGLSGVVFASCHYDICEWLQPDWVFDTASEKFSDRGWERPSIGIELSPCGVEAWPIFSKHHYLDSNINKGARCWLATWGSVPVGFTSMIALPNPYIKNAWREHRTVVLPDFQGLGIGVRISDALGEISLSQGLRFFSKTSHPRMGEYRERSPAWRPTSKNKMDRKDYLSNRKSKESGYKHKHAHRFTYSHEYVGLDGKESASGLSFCREDVATLESKQKNCERVK